MTRSEALKIVTDKFNYYHATHDANCKCWSDKYRHRLLSGCTCDVGKAIRMLKQAAGGTP